ncbi:hypothetical protein GGX14DRAFT_621221 [Mycena pura]|uniref:GSKIP domain-containing protein n=1 Tax=Mycena pura TaxID=153505 RepID=A0AAD6VK18_9AGAR|nr:hypothetical protein GGX14DRAFT_621221 [Mycena pura]
MSTFCADELRNALAEESSASAIESFRLTSVASLCATASVTLLEGSTISINLTTSGYSIIPAGGQNDMSTDSETAQTGPTFESIDQLLRSVSAMYEKRRQEELMAALEKI